MDWNPMGSQFSEIIDIASELEVPILIHTSNKKCCHSGMYEQLIRQHPYNTFILAHGRPVEETLRIVSSLHNVYVDTAFMPIDDIKTLIRNGLTSKILWGTDMCIPQYFFSEENMIKYYNIKLDKFRKICNKEQFEIIISKNAMKVFNIL